MEKGFEGQIEGFSQLNESSEELKSWHFRPDTTRQHHRMDASELPNLIL